MTADTIQKIADDLEGFILLSDQQRKTLVDRLRALSARASAGEGGPVLWVSRDALQQATACANADRPTVATVNAWNDPQRLTGHDPIALYTATPQPAQAGASGGGDPERGKNDPSWSLHDRVEFALRDAGFDYDEAFRIAQLTTRPTPEAQRDALVEAARKVCWFDWSDNDDDAVQAIAELRLALPAQGEGSNG